VFKYMLLECEIP